MPKGGWSLVSDPMGFMWVLGFVGQWSSVPGMHLDCLCFDFSLCRVKRRNGRNPTLTVPASTAPQCAPSARLAWGRKGRGGERKRGVGYPLYSVLSVWTSLFSWCFPGLCSPGLSGSCSMCLCLSLRAVCEALSWCQWAFACQEALSGSCHGMPALPAVLMVAGLFH